MTTNSVSVTEFKAHCLELIHQVERAGTAVDLTRHGKVVARLVPTTPAAPGTPPWLRLRGTGVCHAAAGEAVLDAGELDALREGVK